MSAGTVYGFIGPIKPPSKWGLLGFNAPDARWHQDHLVSTSYAWGRHDAGQRRDTNDIFKFGEAWADAQWEYRSGLRASLPSMQGAYEKFFAGECI
jgi:hypothetical protein